MISVLGGDGHGILYPESEGVIWMPHDEFDDVDERIAEVPAPDAGSIDVMAMVEAEQEAD